MTQLFITLHSLYSTPKCWNFILVLKLERSTCGCVLMQGAHLASVTTMFHFNNHVVQYWNYQKHVADFTTVPKHTYIYWKFS